MRKIVRRALLFGFLSFIWVTFGHANPACHSVLTGDTELTHDLDGSAVPGDPLAIGANGITLRLNGWTLTCPPGFVNSGGELDVEGVRATGRTGVIVLGPGTITGCGRVMTFQGGSSNLAAGFTLVGNPTGIVFIGETNSTAWNNMIVGNLGNGIELSSATGVQILSNLIEHNGKFSKPFTEGRLAGFNIFGGDWNQYAQIVVSRVIADTLLSIERGPSRLLWVIEFQSPQRLRNSLHLSPPQIHLKAALSVGLAIFMRRRTAR